MSDNVANVNVEGSSPFARLFNDPVSPDAGSFRFITKSYDLAGLGRVRRQRRIAAAHQSTGAWPWGLPFWVGRVR